MVLRSVRSSKSPCGIKFPSLTSLVFFQNQQIELQLNNSNVKALEAKLVSPFVSFAELSVLN